MIQILRQLLSQILSDIDSGNSNISEQEEEKLITLLQELNQKLLSRTQSANYINKSTATFDNYVRKGLIPQGKKRQGWKELSWRKCDLDKFLKEK